MPHSQPLLGYLVGGFVLLVVGLAALTRTSPRASSIHSRDGTRRALSYALAFGLCISCFYRVLSPALLGREQSPWLLALGDVLCVTSGLFVWVMVLAERWTWRDYGFHGDRTARMVVTIGLGLAAAALFVSREAIALATGQVRITPDAVVFALLFAGVGSALPEELLFRGYLQGSLDRAHHWARLGIPALAFAGLRAFRYLPGGDLPLDDWLSYVVGVALPLGIWWGLMRDLAGGSLWPSLVSHFVLEFVRTLVNASPA